MTNYLCVQDICVNTVCLLRARDSQGQFYGYFLHFRYCLNLFLLGGKSDTDSVLALLTWFSSTKVIFAAVISKLTNNSFTTMGVFGVDSFFFPVLLFCFLCWLFLLYIFQFFCLYLIVKLVSLLHLYFCCTDLLL